MEQQHPLHSVDSLEEPEPIHSQAPLGAPPTLEGLADIGKGYINGKVLSKSHATSKRSPKFKSKQKPDVASLPTVTKAAIATRQQPRSKDVEQPQPKAIEYNRWRDRLLNPRLASEKEICIELERELLPDEKQRWDNFRQYLRSLAGDNAENKTEAQAFQPFRNRTRLSWRVVEIAEHEGNISRNGKAVQTTKRSPYICIEGVRTKENAQNLHAFLSKRRARSEYHPQFKLCYSLAHIEAPGWRRFTPLRDEEKTLSTLCGQLVVEKIEGSNDGFSAFTIGGLLQIGAEVFALSSRHAIVSEETTETDKSPGHSIEHSCNSTDIDDDADSILILGPESPEYETKTNGRSIWKIESSTESTENSTKKLADLVGDMVYAGDEWCLYRVEDPSRHLPNCVSRTPADGMVPWDPALRTYYINIFAMRPVAGAVVVVGGRSGLVCARMSPNASDIFLPSGKILEVWRITFETGCIRLGDSGSWVVDLESGVVFGHIIAMTNAAAYVLPIMDVIRDIDSTVNSPLGCRLVSAFDCLANLAKFHVKSSPMQAEASARRALSLEVLDHSDPSGSVTLLQTYLREGYRTPGQQRILVELLLRYGSDLDIFIASESALVQAEEIGLANLDFTFIQVASELRKIAQSSQEYTSAEHSKPQSSSSPVLSVQSVAIGEDLEPPPPRGYSVEDMNPDNITSTDPWVSFSRSRFTDHKELLKTLKEADWDVIQREQRRVAYLRRHFGTERVHSGDQGCLLDEISSAHRLWRKDAAARANDLFRHGKHRALSIRDSMIVYRVRHWRHDSMKSQEKDAQGPYDHDSLSEFDLDDDQDGAPLDYGWGYAGVMALHQEAESTTRFRSRRLPMKNILRMASGGLSQTDAPGHGKSVETNGAPGHGKSVEMDGRIMYFHLPANHTRWVEDFMSAYYKVSGHGNLPYDQGLLRMDPYANKPFRWNRRQHEGSLAPVHARQIVPHGSTNLLPPCDESTEIEMPDQYVSLFIPYLSSEEYSSVQRARHFVRASDSTHADQPRVPVADPGTSRTREGKGKQANPLVDFLGKFRGGTLLKGLGQRTANTNAWLPIPPLARYLICAARLYKLFEEAEMVETINLDVRGPLPVHMRRTLEQYRNWPSADNTDRQDMEQTARQESLRQRRVRRRDSTNALPSTLVMVDQLWLWILDDKTILSSFPRCWGDRHGQSPTDVYSHIDHRLRNAHPEEIESAYDVALVIVEECSKTLFRQDTGMDVMDLYGSAISRLATTISAAYRTFKSDVRAASIEDTLSSMGTLLRRSQGLSKEWRSLDEVERAMKELKAMGKVLSQQVDVLAEFESILRRLDHDKVKNRASILVKEITARRSEVEELHSLAKAVTVEFGKLEDLQQQQVSTAHARIALQGVYEQGLRHANSSPSTTPQHRINSKGRVVSARGRAFVEKSNAKDTGSSAIVSKDKLSVWAKVGEAVGLRKRGTASEKRLGAGTTTTSRMV